MFSSRYLSTFEERCVYWQKSLAGIAEVIAVIAEVQRLWSFLENLFIGSEEVKKLTYSGTGVKHSFEILEGDGGSLTEVGREGCRQGGGADGW